MTPRLLALRGSAALALLVAVASAQGRPIGPEAPADTLTVPTAKAPVVDGRTDDEAWRGAVPFHVMNTQEDKQVAHGRLLVSGRQLYIAFVCEHTPGGCGIRFNFVEPASQRVVSVLVTPLSPPHSPMMAFVQGQAGGAEPISCVPCELVFDAALKTGFAFEARLPLDLLGVPRANRPHSFSVEAWDLLLNQPAGVFPGPVGTHARIVSNAAWGAATPDAELPRNEGIAILEEIAGEKADAEDGGVLYAYTGWGDGRRRDAPLARMEERVVAAIERYPGYASLQAVLVQLRKARNDFKGAVDVHAAMGRAFPAFAEPPFYTLIHAELLQPLGRFDEAVALLADRAAEVDRPGPLKTELVQLEALAADHARSLVMQKADAAANDLPRVAVTVKGKGTFVIELFEDDAPNGVANFVSLCKGGKYSGTRFHWVEGGRGIFGGDPLSRDDDPSNDGFGDPGYLIESEPSRRLHLPLTVAYADKRRERRTEGSTFTIHLAPTPAADGVGTVFGRIVDGVDVVHRIEYYDVIEKTEILRLRDHPYEPVRRAK
jgi:peptidyl-prolyl cis-trans isomerase B (cyclophilin B)